MIMYFLNLKLNNVFSKARFIRNMSIYNMFVEPMKKRAILKISGPDTVNYLQSMITNDMKNVVDFPAMYSLLLNSRGKVLYDILLYKVNDNEYFVEYDNTAVEYLHRHLLMYRLRKHVNFELQHDYLVWAVYPDSEQDTLYFSDLENLKHSLNKQENIITSVIDPRTNLLGMRIITKKNVNTLNLSHKNINFTEGNSYRLYRYKLGIGEGVFDHPTGICLPMETNVDFLNGVSFSKGCYLGQEFTARSHFTMTIRKRLMPIIFELKSSYPEFSPECTIINEKEEKVGRLRSNAEQFGLALLKYEECLKAKCLQLKDFNLKLTTAKPKWWPHDVHNN